MILASTARVQYLTHPEAATAQTSRWMVEIASPELDYRGVPETFITLDVVVVGNTEKTVREFVTASHWGKWGYEICDIWQPDDDEAPF